MNRETPRKQPGGALSALPGAALAGFLNHLLKQQSWAAARLRPHAGKTLRLAPAPAGLTIQPDGSVAPATGGAPIDAVLTPNPLAWLLASDPAARFVAAGDNAGLARELADIFGQLRWDAEEDLSRIVGDIAAHKLVSGANGVLDWHKNAATTLARAWAEHWQEDSPLLAQPAAVRGFSGEVAALCERVERLERKIDRLDHLQ
ncbi:MAG: ubiquinone biosynthesis protein [Sulfuricella sp.]|nr:ubiquinone biosynthesis protein [Sulfuricella sp.]